MKASVVSLFSGLFVLLQLRSTSGKVFLNVSPNRQQFFTGEPVRLSCEEEEDGISAAGWTLKRELDRQPETCGVDKRFQRCRGATYNVSALSAADRGNYWCEDPRGNKTLKVTITVSDRPLILDIPALPVVVGGSITLRCKKKDGSPDLAHFFKFGKHSKPLNAALTEQVTIINVQKSDKGSYWCLSGREKSASSELYVRDPPPVSSQYTVYGLSWLRLFCHLVVICPYCITTGLLISIHCSKQTDETPVGSTVMAEYEVIRPYMEYEYAAAVVTTKLK